MKRALACALLLLLTAAAPVRAWDLAGHMLVGQIAWSQLSPEARAELQKLMPLLPNQYNQGKPYNFVTAGAWMDDMRSMPKYPWSAWHYVNEVWNASATGFSVPEGPNVIWAMSTLR